MNIGRQRQTDKTVTDRQESGRQKVTDKRGKQRDGQERGRQGDGQERGRQKRDADK